MLTLSLLSFGEGWKSNSPTDSKVSVAWLTHERYLKQLFCRSCLPSFSLFSHLPRRPIFSTVVTDRSQDSHHVTSCKVLYRLGN
jgi:hypothetical protein